MRWRQGETPPPPRSPTPIHPPPTDTTHRKNPCSCTTLVGRVALLTERGEGADRARGGVVLLPAHLGATPYRGEPTLQGESHVLSVRAGERGGRRCIRRVPGQGGGSIGLASEVGMRRKATARRLARPSHKWRRKARVGG